MFHHILPVLNEEIVDVPMLKQICLSFTNDQLPSITQSKRKKKKAEVAVLKNSLLDRHKWLSTIAYYQFIKMNVWMLNHTLSDRAKW